jgi:hypothetical protein
MVLILLAALVTPFGPVNRHVETTDVSVPIRCDASNGIFVSVAVNGGQSRPFLIDTGASLTTIDIREADRLGLQSIGIVPSPSGPVPLVNASLTIGGRSLPPTPVVAEDLKALTSIVGRVGGILGSDLLRALGTLTIDYEHCTLIVGASEAASSGRAAAVSLDWHEGRPVVSVAGGGRLLLDSGATTLTLFHGTRAAGSLTWSSSPAAVVRIERVDGIRIGRVGRVARLAVGRVELENVTAVSVRSWYGPGDSSVPDGLLPLSLFSRVHLDYRRGLAVLLPRSH